MDKRHRYDSLIMYYAHEADLPWKLLWAQIAAESDFNPDAISAVGAKGLCQFMDPTWAEWGEGSPYNPEAAIRAMARYMKWLSYQFGGNIRDMLAAYNFGITRIKRGDPWPDETKRYVERILREV